MLTTTTQEGRHVSHPMGLQEADVDGDLWFFAYDDSGKAAEIRANPEVAPLWSPTVTPWFPDGLETPWWAPPRAAVTGDPGDDRVRNDTVEL